jgi:hypothetical protein
MSYCNHPFDTQTNECLNQAIATLTPKNVCYSSSIILFSRVALVVGIHNLGYELFFKRIFKELSMTTNYVTDYLKYRDKGKECKRNYQRKIHVKVNRSKNQKKPKRSLMRMYRHQLWTRCGSDGCNGQNGNEKKTEGIRS